MTTGSTVPNRLFIYATLKNPIVRLFVARRFCRCKPAVLHGYRKIGRSIEPSNDAHTNGLCIETDEKLLARFDRYEKVPKKYTRSIVELADGPAWVYIKNQ